MKKIKSKFLRKLEESELFFKRSDQGKAMMEVALRQATETLREIRDRITSGESSGDEITDFVFRHQLGASLQMVEKYHGLNNAIASYLGQLVLVIERTEVDTRFHPHLEPKPYDWRLRTHCAVGIIRGDGLLLDMERGVSAIPAGKHLIFSGDPAVLLGNDVLEPNDAPVPNLLDHIRATGSGRDLGASLGMPLRIKNPMTQEFLDGQPCYAIEMIISDDEVIGWFRTNEKEDLLQQVAKYFDHPVPAPATQPIPTTQ